MTSRRITCDKCAAVYKIEENKVGDRGALVRCKKCANLITIEPNTKEKEENLLIEKLFLNIADENRTNEIEEDIWWLAVEGIDKEYTSLKISKDKLKEQIKNGLNPKTLIWNKNMSNWIQLDQIEEFKKLIEDQVKLTIENSVKEYVKRVSQKEEQNILCEDQMKLTDEIVWEPIKSEDLRKVLEEDKKRLEEEIKEKALVSKEKEEQKMSHKDQTKPTNEMIWEPIDQKAIPIIVNNTSGIPWEIWVVSTIIWILVFALMFLKIHGYV